MISEKKCLDLTRKVKIVIGQTEIDKDYFINLINKNKGDLDYKTNVKGKMTNWSLFNKDEKFHQFLESINEDMYWANKFKQPLYLKDSWGNKLEKGDSVTEHEHASERLSGILHLTNNGPGTYFSEIDLNIKEACGKYIIFDSTLLHEVKENNTDETRYTIAFNFAGKNPWEPDPNV